MPEEKLAALEAELQMNATWMASLDIDKHIRLFRRYSRLTRIAEINERNALFCQLRWVSEAKGT